MEQDRLALETLKLLVEVAWADREIAPEEALYLESLADQTNAPPEAVAELRQALGDSGRLPAPDIHMLRRHRDDVLRAVDALIRVDHRVVADELAAREAIVKLLDGAD